MERRLVATGVLALALVAPAAAGAAGIAGRFALSGTLVVSWQGAPGRCEAAGVCGVHGTLVYSPANRGSFRFTANGDEVSEHGPSRPAVVRVQRDGADATCVEALSPPPDLDVERVAGVGVALRLAGSTLGAGLSAGRCAGPLADDLASALPRADVRPGRAHVVSLAGTTRFSAGAFAGEVTSSVRARVAAHTLRRARRAPRPRPVRRPPARARVVRRPVVEADATYAITAIRSDLAATFTGGGPGCALLDACGLSGRVTEALQGTGSLDFRITAPAPRRRLRTVGQVAALPHARVSGFGDFDAGDGRLSGDAAWPDGAACHDAVAAGEPTVSVHGSRGRARVRLGDDDPDAEVVSRTRCPGPGVQPLSASGPLPLTGARDLQVSLVPVPPLGTGPFSLARTGTATLSLRLRRLSIRRTTEFALR